MTPVKGLAEKKPLTLPRGLNSSTTKDLLELKNGQLSPHFRPAASNPNIPLRTVKGLTWGYPLVKDSGDERDH